MSDVEIIPSPEQRIGLDMIKDWFRSQVHTRPRFILTGVAGSGKSSILKILRKELGLADNAISFVAFTGKASLVLISKGIDATTIHRLMYIPYEVVDPDDPEKVIIKFRKRHELPPEIRLICVDEASMVPDDMQDDLESFGVPVLYVGDHFQLPPVKGECRIFTEANHQMNEIHRQAAGNPIIQVSQMIREGRHIPYGMMGNCFMKIRYEKMDPRQFLLADQILCGKNVTRRNLNTTQRAKRGFTSELPHVGDKVINLRNDWNVGLVNGQIGKITHIHNIDEKRNSITLDFLSDDGAPYRDLISTISSFTGAQPSTKWDGIKRLEMDFAEAITTHKAQGSQWNRVIVVEECFMDHEQHQRWLYTACTRAAQKLIWLT